MLESIETIYDTFSEGEFVVVFDEEREEEGDFFILAEHITPEKINFLLKNARGQICVACAPEILDNLDISLLCEDNENPHGTNFTMTVDAAENVTTGVSAFDRAETIKILANPSSRSTELVRPGHTFPLLAQNPLKRFGHTEAAVELSKKCGKLPVVVICEILDEDGHKASLEYLKKFKIPMTTLNIIKEKVVKK